MAGQEIATSRKPIAHIYMGTFNSVVPQIIRTVRMCVCLHPFSLSMDSYRKYANSKQQYMQSKQWREGSVSR